MKIEILYPEFCNLYSDISNMKYLRKCLPEAEFIETTIDLVPTFVTEKVDLIYLGAMTEKTQEKLIKKLQEYTGKLQELIENGTNFLFTGNSFEILGNYIENEDGSKIEGLNILPIYTKRDMMHRFNEVTLGKFENIELVGYKSQFTQSFGDNSQIYFQKVIKGTGINKETNLEGIKINNFIGTYVLGPILIMNPIFTKYLIKKMGEENPKLAYEKEIMNAYEKRLKDIKNGI